MIAGWLPPDMSAAVAAFLVFASFFTSLLTASFGIGGGLVLLSIMTYAVPTAALIPVHGAVQFGSNTGRAILQRRLIAWPELFAFMAGGTIGAIVGARIVFELPGHLLELLLGAFVLLVTWLRPPKMQRLSLPAFGVTGAVTTFLSMFLGATGPLNVAAFEKTFPERQRMVATLAALTSAQHVLKVIGFGAAGFVFSGWWLLIAAMIAAGFAGTWSGLRILGKMREETFRLVLKIIMTVIGLDLVRRGLFG